VLASQTTCSYHHAARTICSESLKRSGRAKGARVSNTHNGDQDNGVKYRWQDLDASKLNSNDKRRPLRCGSRTAVQGTVCRYDESNKKKVDDVEDTDSPCDLIRGFGNLLLWIGCFRGSQSCQLGASVGERCSDEDTAEAVESIEECAVRIVPVSKFMLA
jgi:hypothetical protein